MRNGLAEAYDFPLSREEFARLENGMGIPGKVVFVDKIPSCNFCTMAIPSKDVPGPFDFATRMGPWAHGCAHHYTILRASRHLGVGMAQLWIER